MPTVSVQLFGWPHPDDPTTARPVSIGSACHCIMRRMTCPGSPKTAFDAHPGPASRFARGLGLPFDGKLGYTGTVWHDAWIFSVRCACRTY